MKRLSQIKTTSTKQVGRNIFLILVFFLMLFPFIQTFNELLVVFIDQLFFLKPFQDLLVSYEARLVRLFLGWLSITTAGDLGSPVITLVGKNGGLDPVAIGWNCVGWQSMVLVGATIYTGIQGAYTRLSKLEVITIGITVTFWINIARLTMIYALYYHIDRETALIFHDYGSVIITIAWLMIFWWFSFKYVLVKSDAN